MRLFFRLLALPFFLSLPFLAIGQIGIGTQNPDASALMDISSQNQGVLLPRMTSAQREAIENPANGLMVFDSDLNAFQYYNDLVATWEELNTEKRDNYVLVKSQADFPAAASGTITLNPGTLYEINGLINLNASIDLNDAYITGKDASEDILSFPGGTVFKGKGGSIKNVTITGSKAFEIDGGGITAGDRLIFQNSIVANITSSVGTITGISLIFGNVVQYSNNAQGIVYNNVGRLLLNNQAWFNNNSGTYETLTGTFTQVQKIGGFTLVDGSNIGMDVSSNPDVASGVVLSRVFSGTGTFIKGYTSGSYPGYSFTNKWNVNCPGLPVESDNVATANIYYNGSITGGFLQDFNNQNEIKLTGNGNANTTTAVNLFRMTSNQNNRITYQGKKTRTFQFNASLSIRENVGNGKVYAFFIRKNGVTTLTETNSVIRTSNSTQVVNNSITGTVELKPTEFIELWVQRLDGGTTNSELAVFSLNLNLK